ncbi:unnamed protein product [Clonostachys rosea]|uniref:FAD dependent oxidoreductase domain-containing protein n=1 Tax=Bionectria ochroleuca TaxID=29856 RepID=A0ABY6URL2_BIOOC|nr:unnamed protein product [Clonostachys rosea]
MGALKQKLKDQLSLTAGLPSTDPTLSFWQEPPASIATAQSETLPSVTDIVIIGSGVTGTSVANTLLNHPQTSGLQVTILEARNTCSGATGRNGGHLVSDTYGYFKQLVDALGLEEATKILQFSEANIAELKTVVAQLDKSEQDAVELREVNATTVAADQETLNDLKRSFEFANDMVSKTTLEYELIEDQKRIQNLYQYRHGLAVFGQRGAAALWPYRLITVLLRRLLITHHSRFSIETNTPVTAISYQQDTAQSGHNYLLHTPRGPIRAQKIIHCTNGYSSHLLPKLTGKLYPLRGTCSLQDPGLAFPRIGNKYSWTKVHKGHYNPETTVLTTGLYYAQQSAKSGEIVIGGESQELKNLLTSDDSQVAPTAADHISSVVPKMYLGADNVKVKKVWSGIMGFTADGLPLVGNLGPVTTGRAGDQEWIAAGFNGHGMDKCWLSGQAVARLAMGEDTPLWFPESFLVSEERLKSLTIDCATDTIVSMFGLSSSKL